jgi:hypothetical protein
VQPNIDDATKSAPAPIRNDNFTALPPTTHGDELSLPAHVGRSHDAKAV